MKIEFKNLKNFGVMKIETRRYSEETLKVALQCEIKEKNLPENATFNIIDIHYFQEYLSAENFTDNYFLVHYSY